jgi:recombination protein RecA
VSRITDVLDLAVAKDIVEKAGSWFSYKGERIGQGRDNARDFLKARPEMLTTLENEVRVKYGLKAREASPADAKAKKADKSDKAGASIAAASKDAKPATARA